jgi:hypothetical protein
VALYYYFNLCSVLLQFSFNPNWNRHRVYSYYAYSTVVAFVFFCAVVSTQQRHGPREARGRAWPCVLFLKSLRGFILGCSRWANCGACGNLSAVVCGGKFFAVRLHLWFRRVGISSRLTEIYSRAAAIIVLNLPLPQRDRQSVLLLLLSRYGVARVFLGVPFVLKHFHTTAPR